MLFSYYLFCPRKCEFPNFTYKERFNSSCTLSPRYCCPKSFSDLQCFSSRIEKRILKSNKLVWKTGRFILLRFPLWRILYLLHWGSSLKVCHLCLYYSHKYFRDLQCMNSRIQIVFCKWLFEGHISTPKGWICRFWCTLFLSNISMLPYDSIYHNTSQPLIWTKKLQNLGNGVGDEINDPSHGLRP